MDYGEARRRMEEALAGYELRFDPLREPQSERARLPGLVARYWELTGEVADSPVTQAAFAQAVADEVMEDLHDDEARRDWERSVPSREGILARCRRAYPAFVRQHHAELLLRERFGHVVRANELDYKGFDFLVIERGLACGLGLSVETPNARAWEGIKAHRTPPAINVPVLHLHLSLSRGRRVGAFILHDITDVDHFSEWMERQRVALFGGVR